MINWKDPKIELPKDGDIIWAIYQHNKKHRYRSSQIICGEVHISNDGKSINVNTDDYTGSGAWGIYYPKTWINSDGKERTHDDVMIGWCHIDDMKLPDFIPHNDWWGDPLK